MKNRLTSTYSSSLTLTAGALALLGLPAQRASAQLVGGFVRPGAVRQTGQPMQGQLLPPQGPVRLRPGPIVRGGLPVYRSAPIYNAAPIGGSPTGYGAGPIYGGGLPDRNGPVTILRPVPGRGGTIYYGNGGYNNGGYNGNGYNGGGYYSNGGGAAEPYYPPGGRAYGGVNLPPVGPGNGFFRNPIPPVGPANGYFTNPIPPVGPGNGFFRGKAPVTGGGPALLGGYYYGNYCNVYAPNSYPSLYSGYSGFPQYVYSTNIVVADPQPVDYDTPSLPFYTPVYQTTYNQTNYYVATPERVAQLQAGGEQAKAALEHAYPADSFQAAFADIAHAWTDNNLDLLRSHLRNADTRISVFLDGKYSYSIASGDFSQITRDALDRLHTVSFTFTHLRKAKNGDVTAYGTHVYRGGSAAADGVDTGVVPFDQAGSDPSADGSALEPDKTVYVSYTLRRYGNEWDVVATDSASHDLAAAASK